MRSEDADERDAVILHRKSQEIQLWREASQLRERARIMTARLALSPPQAFADDAAGFDYFATDFHYVNVVAEIRCKLMERRGFVLLEGPPMPDGTLVARHLDGASDAAGAEGATYRATLVRCAAGAGFAEVIGAYGRELGLRSDATEDQVWPILSQVMRDSRRGITRVLIIDQAEMLDDRGFDELSRFAVLDDPYVLSIVLLTGDGFAERLETTLPFLKPSIIATLPLAHLAPVEVVAFIRHQIEPIGGWLAQAFAPETVSAIADAARGDPRVVNRLARQGLDLYSRSRALVMALPARVEEADADGTSPAPVVAASPAVFEPPQTEKLAAISEAEPPAVPEAELSVVLEAEPPAVAKNEPATVISLPVPYAAVPESRGRMHIRRPSRRAALLSPLSAAVYLLLAAAGAGAVLYALGPRLSSDAAPPPTAEAEVARPGQPAADPQIASRSAAEGTIPAVPPPPPAEALPAVPEPPPALAIADAKPVPSDVPAKTAAAAEPASPPASPEPAPSPAQAAPSRLDAPEKTAATVAPASPPLAAPPRAAQAGPAPSAAPEKAATVAEPVAPPTVADSVAAVPDASTARRVAAIEPSAPAPAEAVALAEPEAAPPRPLGSDPRPNGAMGLLVERGDQLLAAGDVVSARQFFERAAEAGEATGSCGLGKSYDPVFLQTLATRGVTGDAKKAATWYRRAAAAGSSEAAMRLARLLAKYPLASSSDDAGR